MIGPLQVSVHLNSKQYEKDVESLWPFPNCEVSIFTVQTRCFSSEHLLRSGGSWVGDGGLPIFQRRCKVRRVPIFLVRKFFNLGQHPFTPGSHIVCKFGQMFQQYLVPQLATFYSTPPPRVAYMSLAHLSHVSKSKKVAHDTETQCNDRFVSTEAWSPVC